MTIVDRRFDEDEAELVCAALKEYADDDGHPTGDRLTALTLIDDIEGAPRL